LLPEFTADDVMRETAELESELALGTSSYVAATDEEPRPVEGLEVDLSDETTPGDEEPSTASRQ